MISARRPPTATRWMICLLTLLWSIAVAGQAAPLPPRAAVASAHSLATDAGLEILAAGGNAFDAAVAVAAALAVVEPYSSGLGGGGFFLLYRADTAEYTMLDARETAPAAATHDMYLDEEGEPVPGRSRDGALAAAIPGTPAALAELASRYGRLPLARALAPAIRYAREGFPVSERYRSMAERRTAALKLSPASSAIFLKNGAAPPLGFKLVQTDLARTLEALAKEGASGFYQGEVARRLVEGVRGAGGIWTLEDLAAYRVVERKPLQGSYRGLRIVSAPPPSSGGIVLLEALNILERYDLDELQPVQRKHLIIEALRRAYRDRAAYLGDPDFVTMPVERLTGKDHAEEVARNLQLDRATPSASLPPLSPPADEYPNTTHFSVLDQEGNRVAATLSINLPFGSGFTPPGTGVLLNDEMDDFSVKPLTPNAYGLVGVDANAVAGGKRPLSSMTPTFVESDEAVGILGTPGGSRIISMVLLGVLEFEAGKPARDWVSAPRFHHQYLPDQVLFEPSALEPAEQDALRRMGHELEQSSRRYGNMQAIRWDLAGGEVEAASDPRGEGTGRVLEAEGESGSEAADAPEPEEASAAHR